MKVLKKLAWLLAIILLIWLLLTLYVQQASTIYVSNLGENKPGKKAVILFNPDPFYNLDEKIAMRCAGILLEEGWETRILSVAAVEAGEPAVGDLYIMIANTYNWAPDRPTQRTITSTDLLTNKPVVAITLGSGSTARAKRLLEELIRSQKGILIDSETYWLMRPNDDTGGQGSNIGAALEKVEIQARQIAQKFDKLSRIE